MTWAAPAVSVLANEVQENVFLADDHDPGDDDAEPRLEIEYISPVAGRSMGQQPVPRFDIDQLRPS